MSRALNIVFAGTPQFAASHLEALYNSGHNIVAVLTQPDRPAGRGKRCQPSAVKTQALDTGLTVLQPETLKHADSAQALAHLNADLMVVVAYGLILPANILSIPRLGCINVHASLLPKWRGAAPIQRAIESGDRETGVSIMVMEAGLDTGPVLATERLTITEAHTAGSLQIELAALGAATLLHTLEDIDELLLAAATQDHARASYARKIEKSEAQIDWSEPAQNIARRIRAFHPVPGCFAFLEQDRVKIANASASESAHQAVAGEILSADSDGIRVACGEGVLIIKEAQMPGAKPQSAATLLNGHQSRLQPGRLFSGIKRD
jgi:methionyl-tRNA formyltransferase